MGTLIVNKRDDSKQLLLIDGNHRIDALKRFYTMQSGANFGSAKIREDLKVDVTLRVYKNLTDSQMLEVYANEAKRRDQTSDDYLQLSKDLIPLWKSLMTSFPCKVSIYKSTEGLKLGTLLWVLYVEKNSAENYNPRGLRKGDVVQFALACDSNDYLSLCEFMHLFIATFGIVETSNVYARGIMLASLYTIWKKNKASVKHEQLVDRFSKIKNRSELLLHAVSISTESAQRVHALMLEYVNFGYSKNLFK